MNRQKIGGGNFVYDNLKEWDYKLPYRWISAMSQGFALSTMIRAFELTKEIRYLEYAHKVLNSFTVPIEDGGIMTYWNNEVFYEEYPAKQKPHVLNGFIFSLAGLYDYWKYTNDKKAKQLFELGVRSLKKNIKYYNAGFTSYYSMLINRDGIQANASAIGSPPDHYHHLHIIQLLWLYKVTHEKTFLDYAKKFIEYDMGAMEDLGIPNKFKKIKASFTTKPDKFGVENLNDSIWTYGYYWSTHKFPTKLTIELNEKTNELHGIMFASISEDTLPGKFSLRVLSKNGWQTIDSKDIKLKKKDFYKTGKYKTFVKVYNINYLSPEIEKIEITFYKNKKSLVTLREINIFYPREEVLKRLLNRYSNE